MSDAFSLNGGLSVGRMRLRVKEKGVFMRNTLVVAIETEIELQNMSWWLS